METENTPRKSKCNLDLRQGMSLRIADFSPHETVETSFESTNPLLRFYFHIAASGSWEFRSSHGNIPEMKIPHRDRFSMVFFFPKLEGKIHWPADGRQFHVSVTIAPSVLSSYLGPGLEGFPDGLRAISEGSIDTGFIHDGPLSQCMDSAIRQLLDCPYSGAMKRLYTESKAIELIAHKLVQIQSPDMIKSPSVELSRDAIERVLHAREILDRELENPPKLLDLAHSVGTNHSALNRGFRKIYGATVFGYLRELRLKKAKRLLEEEGMNVTEAALSVGYSSIPSFSKAFSHFFGKSPALCLKTRN